MTDKLPQPALDRMIHRLSVLIGTATSALETEPDKLADWYDEVSRQLRRYHIASYLSGSGVRSTMDLPDNAQEAIVSDLKTQLKFLGKFKTEIQDSDEWQAGWNSRAEMYARSIQVPYWRGKTKMLPLPAMPGDGTSQCLTNCRCAWNIDTVNEDQNDYDCYWIYGATEDHCQTCKERQAQWSPLQIRNGEVL